MATAARKPLRTQVRTARLEARVSRDFKDTLERAAAVTGHATLKSFLIYALQSSASKAIEDHRGLPMATIEQLVRFSSIPGAG